jgi:hypothetical protein
MAQLQKEGQRSPKPREENRQVGERKEMIFALFQFCLALSPGLL